MTAKELRDRLSVFGDDEKIVFTEHDGRQYRQIAVVGGDSSNSDGTCMMDCFDLIEEYKEGS